MARNGSGTYTTPNTFVAGEVITASDHNENWSDAAAEITNSVAADGQTTMTGPLKAASGTAAAPGLAFGADTDSGIYRKGANELGFSTAGTAAGYFDAAKKFWALGAVDIAGALSITGTIGAASFSSTVAVTGNFAINTNKFTVTASSGNTLVAGTFDATGAGAFASTLSATGNFAINANKFNVTAASGNTTIAGTLGVTGAVSASSSVLSTSATAGVGYTTGAGGTVTQLVNKATAVVLNKVCGSITLHNSTLNAGAQAEFTFTNSAIGPADVLVLNHISAGTLGVYLLTASCQSGFALINVRNITAASSLSEAIVLQFAVIKAVTS